MCCPNGSSCEAIRPITCDIEAQNPSTNLKAPIKTLALKSKLPKCATNNSCCPFGFTCADDGKLCLKNPDQLQPPEGYTAITSSASTAVPASTSTKSSPATTATATTSASASASAGVSASASASPSAESSPAAPGNDAVGLGAEKTSIIGGAVGGALALLLLIVIIFLCIRSRKSDASSVRSFPYSQSSGVGLHRHKISAPISNPETSYRSDFIRKTPSVRSSRSGQPASRYSRTPQLKCVAPVNPRLSIPNPFDSPTPSSHSSVRSRCSDASDHYDQVYTGQVGARLKPIRALTPSAVRESRRVSRRDVRDATGDTSGVFADGSPTNDNKSGQSHYRQTSFSDMMEEASMKDVHRSQPYVPGGTKRHVPGTTPRI
ncbi:hypothetical protein E4U42_006486 [Claviceps africana]|uniref:Mid2 domain-containing protein n=1 Tax=Claviceps africana TaxID=83212 RepID=A0A8K0J8A0_9HYPO|nr:hypothetical protein E4U42_006486 [Claviceps africana]